MDPGFENAGPKTCSATDSRRFESEISGDHCNVRRRQYRSKSRRKPDRDVCLSPLGSYGPEPLGLWESVTIAVVVVAAAAFGWYFLYRNLSDLTDAVENVRTEIGDIKKGPPSNDATKNRDNQNSSGEAPSSRKSGNVGPNLKKRSGAGETDGASPSTARPEGTPPEGR
jgi:hypothetical protein